VQKNTEIQIERENNVKNDNLDGLGMGNKNVDENNNFDYKRSNDKLITLKENLFD
jgi:hypothetical protein